MAKKPEEGSIPGLLWKYGILYDSGELPCVRGIELLELPPRFQVSWKANVEEVEAAGDIGWIIDGGDISIC